MTDDIGAREPFIIWHDLAFEIFHLSFGRYLVAKPANQIANEQYQMPNDKLNLIRPPCVCRSCALSSEVFPSG